MHPISMQELTKTDASSTVSNLHALQFNQPAISGRFVQSILRHVLNTNDRFNLLSSSQIAKEHYETGQGYVTAKQLATLQSNAIMLLNDEMLGYADCALPVGTWKVMSRACVSAVTLGELLERYCEFYGLFPWGMALHYEIKQDFVHLAFSPTRQQKFESFLYESCIHNTHRFFSWMIDTSIPVPMVNLTLKKPLGAQYYQQILPFSKWNFEQPQTEFLFPAKLLDAPCQQDEIALKKFWRQTSYHLLASRYNARSWSTKIRKVIHELQDPAPSFEQVAEILNIHPQTLRRRLLEEGTHYRGVKNQIRHEQALFYLNKPGLSIDDVAENAGFSDTRSFVRAFKNWTGMTPHSYRDQK